MDKFPEPVGGIGRFGSASRALNVLPAIPFSALMKGWCDNYVATLPLNVDPRRQPIDHSNARITKNKVPTAASCDLLRGSREPAMFRPQLLQ